MAVLTIFRDLTEAVAVRFALGSGLFIHRMSWTTGVMGHTAFVTHYHADSDAVYEKRAAANPYIVIYGITSALFFGATASIGSVLDRINDEHKALIMDFSNAPFQESTGANTARIIISVQMARAVIAHSW